MGVMKEWKPNGGKPQKSEPNAIRCIYRAEIGFLVRTVDVSKWVSYIEDSLPNSYEGQVSGARTAEPVTEMFLAYTAASANANDITQRLRMPQMYHIPISSTRDKTCGCPSGTTKCVKRIVK
jgi:hypothetical protein